MGRGWTKHMRGSAAMAPSPKDPASAALETTVRDFRNAKLLREMDTMGQPQDQTVQAIVQPILQVIGEELTQRVKSTGHAPTGDEIDQLIDREYNRETKLSAIERLRGRPDHNPTPNTTNDLTSMATAAVDIHKGAADTSRQMAEEERLRRKEAEASVGNAVQQAVADEQEKSMTLLDMVKQMFEQRSDHESKLHDIETKMIQSQSQSQVEEIKKISTDAIEKLTGAFNEKLASLQRAHELELKLIEKDHEFEKFKLSGATGISPQDKLNHIWAEVTGENLKHEADYNRRKREAELDNEKQKGDLIKQGLAYLPNVIGALGGAGQPTARNGIPPEPPQPPVPPAEAGS